MSYILQNSVCIAECSELFNESSAQFLLPYMVNDQMK